MSAPAAAPGAQAPAAPHRLEPLLNPRSIAVIGASDNAARIGGMGLAHSLRFGYGGALYPVNPKYTAIQGLPCWPDIESLPEAPELAVLAIGAAEVTPMLRRCHAHGVRAAMVYAAGFAESPSAEGQALQRELQGFARDSGMVVAGPNLMGFANLNTQAHTSFGSVFGAVPMQPGRGHVAVLTQSGNVCAALYALLRKLDVPLSHFINTGNEASVDLAAYLSYLAQDEATEVVLAYIEQLRDGAAFIAAAAELARRGKLLVAFKAGDTEKGSEAVRSHTAALAGDQRVYRAAFAQLGVVWASDFAQMAQLARAASYRNKSGGRRVGIVTISGAMGAILADKLIGQGLQVPTLPEPLQALLRAGIPDYGMVSNPVDVTGNVVNEPGFVRAALDALAATDALDAVLVYAPGYLLDRMADGLCAVAAAQSRLIVAIDTGEAQRREQLRAGGVPVFDDIGVAVAALAPLLHWQAGRAQAAHWQDLRARPARSGMPAAPLPARPDEHQAKRYLAAHGMPAAREHAAASADEAVRAAEALGYPVVLKVLDAAIAHKTEAGGVRLNLRDAAAVRAAFTDVRSSIQKCPERSPVFTCLIQKMEQGVAELIVGATRDAVFGWALTVGLGGVLTELYQDAAHRLLPVDEGMAEAMLRSLKAWPLLDGYRGRPPADVRAACAAIAAFSRAVLALPDDVASVEVNPLLVKPAGEGVALLDALILRAAVPPPVFPPAEDLERTLPCTNP